MTMTKQKVDFIAFMFSILLLLVASLGWSAWDRRVRHEAPATDFLTIREFNVPDFVEGTDPTIVLDATIKADFDASWSIVVKTATVASGTAICNRPGSGHYTVSQKLPTTITLNTFMKRDCGLPPGQYVIDLSVDIDAQDYPTKHYSALSNIFHVLPKGSRAYVTEEEVQQIEDAKKLLDNPIPVK